MGENEFPFSNLDAINEVSNPKLRFSQKNVIRVAENEKDRGRYEESVDLYKKVSEFLNSDAYRLVMQNVETLLKLNAQKKDSKEAFNDKNLKDLSLSNTPGINISIDNINLSGIELNGGKEAVEMMRELFEKRLSEFHFPKPENKPTKNAVLPENEKQKKGSSPSSNNLSKNQEQNPSSSHSDYEEYKSTPSFDFSKLPLEEIQKLIPLLASGSDSEIQEILSRVKNLETLIQDNNSSQNQAASLNQESSQTSKKSQQESPVNQNSPKQNEEQNPFSMQLDQKKDSNPVKIQQVGSTKKIKKLKAVSLTYDFSNMFHNKYYFKFEDMFKEAGRLVNAKKLDEAIDIYNVLLDQKLPETMKMMIKQNVKDLKESIINTFKYSNTFFKVDDSGNAVAVGEAEDSISVISQDHSKNDVYFKE